MPGKPQYTVKHMVRALTECKGLVSYAARRLGCSVRTVENYCTRHAAVRQARDDAREELVDLACLKLFDAAERGEPWAVMFTLRTLGKDRGFSERYEVTGKDGGPIKHDIRLWEENLQRAHARMDAHKAAIRAERALEAGRDGQGDDAEGRRL